MSPSLWQPPKLNGPPRHCQLHRSAQTSPSSKRPLSTNARPSAPVKSQFQLVAGSGAARRTGRSIIIGDGAAGDRLDKALAAGKPILMWKVGNTAQGQKAAASHTASLAGGGAASSAFLRQIGVAEVNTPSELIETLKSRGARPVAGTPQGFAQHIAESTKKWAVVVKASGARID